jgi:signal transduction histidine kinase/ABC-type amino acid transport substrate-binding protein
MIAEKQKIKKSFQINNLLFFVVALLPFLITSSFSFASSNKPLLFLGDKDYPPYEWLEEGTPTGLNVDICREVSRAIGREIKVELMQWKTAQEKVLKGEADGLIEIDISEERQKLYDLTETTIEFSYSLFIRSDNVVISEVSDVEGKKAGVTAGGYPRRVLAKNPKIDLIFVKNYLEGFEYLKSGKIDALGADTWVAPYLIQKHGIKGIMVTGDPFFKINGAFAVKKGNTKLLNEIDAGIKKLIKDGTLDRLKKKWSRKEIIFLTQERLQRIYIIVTILFLGIFSGLLLLWIFTLKKQIRKRIKAEAELQQAHDDLEERVQERTAGLEKVNKQLKKEIEERKRAEEGLAKHREHLEELIRERTAELEKRVLEVEQLNSAMVNLMKDLRVSNENLKTTTHHLANANKELEAFSYSVSHDLRAPLRSVDGFSQILLEDYSDTLDEKGKHYLERARAGTQKMGQLIDDILNLSRIGRQPMEMKKINMKSIAREVYNSLEDEWKGRKVDFNVHKCPPADADLNLIKIVFMNLLSNALKFTGNRKEAKIEVGSETKDEQTVFFVKDNGAGFDMKYADKLFTPFQRLHRVEEYEGTGIGLAIVQRIIHRHSGRIWPESKVGKGTTFYFTV